MHHTQVRTKSMNTNEEETFGEGGGMLLTDSWASLYVNHLWYSFSYRSSHSKMAMRSNDSYISFFVTAVLNDVPFPAT